MTLRKICVRRVEGRLNEVDLSEGIATVATSNGRRVSLSLVTARIVVDYWPDPQELSLDSLPAWLSNYRLVEVTASYVERGLEMIAGFVVITDPGPPLPPG